MVAGEEEVEESANQLQQELQANTLAAFDARASRPILKHLNADSSWLLSLPYPAHAEKPYGRCRYNIVIDPWLRGPQVDLFSWFSSQEHATPSQIQSLKDLNDFLAEAEKLALGGMARNDDGLCYIDAVCVCHEFTDHCHEATLRELDPSVPVFASRKAASIVKSWKHFEHVVEIPVYERGYDWQGLDPLSCPDWVGIGRIHTRGDTPIHFHSALLILFSSDEKQSAEAVVYTPHGVAADSLTIVKSGKAPCTVLALLHGLHDISLMGAQLNMGVKNALEAQQDLRAKYWFPTHDEVKVAHGVVASFLKRIEHTLQIAPGSHPITEANKQDTIVTEKSFVELLNGQTFLLA